MVHNTVVDNNCGIVLMPRGDVDPLKNERVLNNLLIRNYIAGETLTEGCDLTLYMYPPFQADQTKLRQAEVDNLSDFNVFAANDWVPTIRYHWNPNVTLAEWQTRFHQDLHSRLMPIQFERRSQGFKLLTSEGLDVAGPLPEKLLKSGNPRILSGWGQPSRNGLPASELKPGEGTMSGFNCRPSSGAGSHALNLQPLKLRPNAAFEVVPVLLLGIGPRHFGNGDAPWVGHVLHLRHKFG